MAAWRFFSLLMIALSGAVAAPASAGRVSPRLVAFLHHYLVSSQETIPSHARLASVSAGHSGIVHFVLWSDPDPTRSGGGQDLNIYLERGRKVNFVGLIPITDGIVTLLPARAGWLPDFMVNRSGAHQVYSRIAYNGWRYHPIWDKPPSAFPGEKLPGRISYPRVRQSRRYAERWGAGRR